MKIIYIAGKVSGLPHSEAAEKFQRAAIELSTRGFLPVNPINVVGNPNATWEEAMKKCIAALVKCDAVYLLPCHISSPGASLELHLADLLKIPVCTKVDDFIQYIITE